MKSCVKISCLVLAFAVAACSSDKAPTEPVDDDDVIVTPAATLALAGNIVACGNLNNSLLTASIIDTLPATTTVMALGDNVRAAGTGVQSMASFTDCYDGSWGRFKSRTKAAVGNHEQVAGADGHWGYFGAAAGPTGQGWYSFEAGTWHIIVLNIHDTAPDGPTSEQMVWLRADLLQHAAKKCVMAVWHDPYYLSSNIPGFNVRTETKHVWNDLYANKVDVVVTGGQHQYERMRRMDPNGNIDDVRGILQINAGTGGDSKTEVAYVHPNQAAFRFDFGVLVMKLHQDRYDFTFVSVTNPVAGNDSGSGTCH